MALSGDALLANWKLFEFLPSMVVNVIFATFVGASAHLLVECALCHAVCHALRCVMCSVFARFAPFAVY